MNIFLVLAYDGAAYHGFQKQKGVPTVQEAIEEALCALFGKRRIALTGAARTDALVHALYQVVNFRIQGLTIPPSRIAPALNAHLPASIRALSSRRVRGAFHARYYARWKTYDYFFYTGPTPLPFLRDRAVFVPSPLNLRKMQSAARLFLGDRDFSSFGSVGSSQKNGHCKITACRLQSYTEPTHTFYRLTLTANRFLFHMVRNIAGILIELGNGRRTRRELHDLLEKPRRLAKKQTAPAQGLYLSYIHYEEEDLHSELTPSPLAKNVPKS